MEMSLDSIQKILFIQKHRLDDELEMQAEMIYRITESTALATSRKDAAKNELEQIEAKIFEEAKSSEEKLNDSRANGIVVLDPRRITAWRKYQEARSIQEKWWGMLEAWKQRGYSLKTLADLYLANYFTVERVQNDSSHQSERVTMIPNRKELNTPSTTRRRALVD